MYNSDDDFHEEELVPPSPEPWFDEPDEEPEMGPDPGREDDEGARPPAASSGVHYPIRRSVRSLPVPRPVGKPAPRHEDEDDEEPGWLPKSASPSRPLTPVRRRAAAVPDAASAAAAVGRPPVTEPVTDSSRKVSVAEAPVASERVEPSPEPSVGPAVVAPTPVATPPAQITLPLPSDADLASWAGIRRKLLDYLALLGARLLPGLMESGRKELDPGTVRRILQERGHRYVYQDETMYDYMWPGAGSGGVYRKAEKAFRQRVLALAEEAQEEFLALYRAVSEMPKEVAAPLMKQVPMINPDRVRVKCTDLRSMAAVYQPEGELDDRENGESQAGRMNGDVSTINVRNGLLDIHTRTLRPHTPEHLSSIQLPFDYDPTATCPHWECYLAEAVPDPEVRAVLQEWMGYLLVPTTILEKVMFLLGAGGTGKSTFIKIARKLVGEGNCSAVSLEDLDARFKATKLRDKLLNVCTEVNPNKVLNDARFKAFISGDPVTAEDKFKPAYVFQPYARHMVAANTLPRIPDQTDAFYRRCIVVKFEQKFRPVPNPAEGERQADPGLEKKLEGELSGILNWALEGKERLFARGKFEEPSSVQANVREFREEQNPVLRFLTETCDFNPTSWVTTGELYRDYQQWCRARGERAVSDNVFGKVVVACPGVKKDKSGSRGRYYRGIAPFGPMTSAGSIKQSQDGPMAAERHAIAD